MRSWNNICLRFVNRPTRVRNLPMRSWNISGSVPILSEHPCSQFTNEELKHCLEKPTVSASNPFAIYQWGVETNIGMPFLFIFKFVRNLPMRSWNNKNFSIVSISKLCSQFTNEELKLSYSFVKLSLYLFLVRNLPMRSWNDVKKSELIFKSCSQFTNEELKHIEVVAEKLDQLMFAIYQWGVETSLFVSNT